MVSKIILSFFHDNSFTKSWRIIKSTRMNFLNLRMPLITELINTSWFGSWAVINPKLPEAINKIPESNSNLCIAPGVCREWLKNFSPNERSEESSSWNKCFNFWTHLKSKFRMSVTTLFSQTRIWILRIVLENQNGPCFLFAIFRQNIFSWLDATTNPALIYESWFCFMKFPVCFDMLKTDFSGL